MKKLFLTIIITLAIANNSMSYDNKTAHRDFNTAIVEKFKSSYSNWTEFKNYNFRFDLVKITGSAVTESGYLIVKTDDRSYTIKDWIKEGGYSADEPEVPAAYRHFYDPTANDGKTYLTDINKAGAQFNPDVDAIFWHFIGNDVNGNNEWSWYVAKDYMIKAIANGDEKFRNQYLAKAFRALGEVLHNTADMGCPPHVRNDAHGGFGLGGSDPYEGGFQPVWITDFAGNSCDANLKSQFIETNKAMDVNKQLAVFTNKYFFSDETIAGNGVELYNSRNGKKDFPNPKLDKLSYDSESFNYNFNFPSGRKVQMCNDQSVLLGFLTTNYRSYPRVTLKNVETQASELVPAIIEAGIHVMHHFIPVLTISLEIKTQDKIIEGNIKHTATTEYPNSLNYNGKVSFLVDGKISKVTSTASNGKFSVSETDKKFPGAKNITAYIELADIKITSDEYSLDEVLKFNHFVLTIELYAKTKYTNLVNNTVSIDDNPAYVVISLDEAIIFQNNQYIGSWLTTDVDKTIREGSIKIVRDGGKTATIDLFGKSTLSSGETYNYSIKTKAIPFAMFNKDTNGDYRCENAFSYLETFLYENIKPKVSKSEYIVVEANSNGKTGFIYLGMDVK